jgi:hypothetical protein
MNVLRRLSCLWLAALAAAFPTAAGAVDFDRYFLDATMRIDFVHVGDAKEEMITLDRVLVQGPWAGNPRALLDDYDTGRYFVKVSDAASGTLLYSRGFDSYFGEYKTSAPALAGEKRAYFESALIPCPKAPVRFAVEIRGRDNRLGPLFSRVIDPADKTVVREKPPAGIVVVEAVKNGPPGRKVDLAVLGEGYTRAEEGKFRADLGRVVALLFREEPYRSLRDRFNVRGVLRPSDESGCDEPGHGSFRATALGATFDSLGSDRYVLTEDNRSLRDVAGAVPYDALLIMVNYARYGGGGIYNLYCVFTIDNQWWEYLVLHEFGHSFGGLGDEYYTSDVAYNDFYPAGIEPTEPNITALLDPARLKWKDAATPGIAVPTPWEKPAFDAMDTAYQKIRREVNAKIAGMKRGGAPAAAVAEAEADSERLSREQAAKVDAYLRASCFWGTTGAFEGAGYAARGLYRPALDCLMFTKGTKPLCAVCERAIVRVVRRLSD